MTQRTDKCTHDDKSTCWRCTAQEPQTTTLFSEEADTCTECAIAGFTINEAGVIANAGKFEAEPLVTYHAYHVMLDGGADDEAGEIWRIGNVIAYESEAGFVTSQTFDSDEDAAERWLEVI